MRCLTDRLVKRRFSGGSLLGHIRLAGCLAARGRYDEAYDHACVFSELAPRNSWGWTHLGRICIERGEGAESAGALRRAIRLERAGSYETPAAGMLASLRSGLSELQG